MGLAWLWPEVGTARQGFDPSQIASWGVGAVFFFYGLKLNATQIKAGLANYKLHMVVQIATFVLFPLLVLAVMPWQGPSVLWLGIFFVAALPSTVSSSVVMVSIAKGNVPAAIFNASISSLLGVFLTPLWMSIFVDASSGGAPLGDVVIKLILQVVVPVGAGMMLHKWWGRWAEGHRTTLRWFDQTVILAIVYTSFCEGFAQGIFASVSWSMLGMLCMGMVVLFFVPYAIIGVVCRWLRFDRQDTITALFCGSKKSLVHGTVMSKIIISNPAMVSILLLPIMVYHALQLIIVSFIAGNMAKKK